MAHLWVNKGYEGAMLKHFKQEYKQGKLTNDIIKIKPRKTADLLCIGIKEGEGKYEEMIGSLVLVDSEHRVVYVGSGLSDELREMGPEEFVGLVIEIEYEQLLDTYIQPVFKEIRYDKNEEEID
jgi:DNA ligase-1